MVQEKNRVAFISVLAAIFLTGFKLIDRAHVHIHTEPETSTDFTNLIINN